MSTDELEGLLLTAPADHSLSWLVGIMLDAYNEMPSIKQMDLIIFGGNWSLLQISSFLTYQNANYLFILFFSLCIAKDLEIITELERPTQTEPLWHGLRGVCKEFETPCRRVRIFINYMS